LQWTYVHELQKMLYVRKLKASVVQDMVASWPCYPPLDTDCQSRTGHR
jgi:hypothetical protein